MKCYGTSHGRGFAYTVYGVYIDTHTGRKFKDWIASANSKDEIQDFYDFPTDRYAAVPFVDLIGVALHERGKGCVDTRIFEN